MFANASRKSGIRKQIKLRSLEGSVIKSIRKLDDLLATLPWEVPSWLDAPTMPETKRHFSPEVEQLDGDRNGEIALTDPLL